MNLELKNGHLYLALSSADGLTLTRARSATCPDMDIVTLEGKGVVVEAFVRRGQGRNTSGNVAVGRVQKAVEPGECECEGDCQSGPCCHCLDKNGWYCTRPKGHAGDHVACAGSGRHAFSRWPQVVVVVDERQEEEWERLERLAEEEHGRIAMERWARVSGVSETLHDLNTGRNTP